MSAAGENTATLRAAPAESPRHDDGAGRDFWVVEGPLGLATRLARFLGTTLLVTFIVGLVGALVLHATIIENQRDLDSRKAEIGRIAAETEAMRHELEELEAPARIVAEARALGMIEAPEVLYLKAIGNDLDPRILSAAAYQLEASG